MYKYANNIIFLLQYRTLDNDYKIIFILIACNYFNICSKYFINTLCQRIKIDQKLFHFTIKSKIRYFNCFMYCYSEIYNLLNWYNIHIFQMLSTI